MITDINNNPTDRNYNNYVDITLLYGDKTFVDSVEFAKVIDVIDNKNVNTILFVRLRKAVSFFYTFYKTKCKLKHHISNEHTKRY